MEFPMKKQKINLEIIAIYYQPFLTCHESKSIAKFQQKILYMCQQCILKLTLRIVISEAGKIEEIWALEHQIRSNRMFVAK